MKKTNWTTERGAKIELTTQDITEETINLDGHEMTVKTDGIKIANLTINGQSQDATLRRYEGKNVLHLGEKLINGKSHPLMVLIPNNIYDEVWGAYDKRRTERIEAEIVAEKKYQTNYKNVMDAMKE